MSSNMRGYGVKERAVFDSTYRSAYKLNIQQTGTKVDKRKKRRKLVVKKEKGQSPFLPQQIVPFQKEEQDHETFQNYHPDIRHCFSAGHRHEFMGRPDGVGKHYLQQRPLCER